MSSDIVSDTISQGKVAIIITSVASSVDQFMLPSIQVLLDLGYSVDVACNYKQGNTCSVEKIADLKSRLYGMGVRTFQIDFKRNVFHIPENLKALRQLMKVSKENHYSLVHCHTPIGGFLGRIVFNKERKNDTEVIYTAHGFHFFKGSRIINWLLFYPIERWLSSKTDVLVTIAKEDFELAKAKFSAKKVVYIPGIGVNDTKFCPLKIIENEKEDLRKSIDIPLNKKVLLSVGELNKNKNHCVVIKAISKMQDTPFYIIAGQGGNLPYLKRLADDLGVSENVRFLGFRTDVDVLLKMADLYVLPSFREGLNVSMMEAMASGLPCVCGDIRGNRDLIDEGKGGFRVDVSDENSVAEAIEKSFEMFSGINEYNVNKIKNFNQASVLRQVKALYMM